MIYKYIVCFLFFANLMGSTLKAQPTGEGRRANVNITFFDRKDTIAFNKTTVEYVSINEKYKLSFFSQRYIIDIKDLEKYNKNFTIAYLRDSTVIYNWKHKLIKDTVVVFEVQEVLDKKIFSFVYFPSSKMIGSSDIEPSQDVIIQIRKGNCKMQIYLKLYNVKSEYEMGSNIDLYIPFQEGVFEIRDPKDPKLIPIKKGRK